MKAELVPENGDPPIPITRDLVVIGRRDYCDIVIEHSSLSKRHCVLVKTDGLLVIRDLISTNGTKVKGQKVRWAALLPDDRIALGSYKLRVYLGPDDEPGPSELAREKAQSLARPTPARRQAQPQLASPASGAPAPAAGPVQSVVQPTFPPGFPGPSRLEVDVISSGQKPPETPVSPEPPASGDSIIPLILDDSDEIIELD
ncbi:MAG: FHA domain-containing protein [Isosphaeraceae bacterium]